MSYLSLIRPPNGAPTKTGNASNPSAISPMVAQLIEGMSVALYTTLVGSILSVWLGLIYQMLATGTSNLISQIIELSER